MNRWLLWTASSVLAFSAVGCVDRQAQTESKATEKIVNNPVKSVTVQTAATDNVTEDVEVTGDVTASDDTTIGSKQTNRVTSVFVKDGDVVSKGQLLATLDDTSAQAQLKQAQAQVSTALANMASARASLAQAMKNYAVGPHRSSVQVSLARAQVSGSQHNLDKVIHGARPEERKQALANLDSAKANLDLQKKQLERIKTLVDQGALSGQSLDQQRATYDQAAAQVKSAQEAVNMNQNGSRQEDIDSAKSQYQQAVEGLRNAEDQKKLDPLLKDQVDAANAQVESARAQLDSARAQIQIANQTIADTRVYAPFAGRVSGRPIQVGTVAGNSTPIVRIVGGAGVYFNGQIPSSNIDKVHPGMAVKVRVDGSSGKVYTGTIVGVNPLADSVGRLFSVRVQFNGSIQGLQPGMFARGTVAIRTISNTVVVSSQAVQTRGDDKYVMVIEGNKARKVKVTTGLTKGEWVQVTGVTAGQKVVVEGQEDLVEGATVNVKGTTTALKTNPDGVSEAQG